MSSWISERIFHIDSCGDLSPCAVYQLRPICHFSRFQGGIRYDHGASRYDLSGTASNPPSFTTLCPFSDVSRWLISIGSQWHSVTPNSTRLWSGSRLFFVPNNIRHVHWSSGLCAQL